MLTGCPKCPVFCLSEGIRFYHLCRWGSQDFIICPGFTCMNWLPGLGRCNNKIKRSDGYFTGHRPWLKSDVVAQDGSRLGGEGLKILSSVPVSPAWIDSPAWGAVTTKKGSDGYFTGHRPWLKSDVVAQDGSRLGGEGLKILSSVPVSPAWIDSPAWGAVTTKKGSDGYFTGHRPWLKSDVVAQDGSRLGTLSKK